jgi:hypothetical protein
MVEVKFKGKVVSILETNLTGTTLVVSRSSNAFNKN